MIIGAKGFRPWRRGDRAERRLPLMALFGPDAMSDLSPESEPKRTSANTSAVAKSGERWSAFLRASAPCI